MLDISIADFGINTHHDPDVIVDRPTGMLSVPWATDCYLVACFRTPFFYLTANGTEEGMPGDCVVQDPVSRQLHGPLPGSADGFRNDWIHIRGSDVPKLIESYGIPLQTRIPTGKSDLITGFLRSIIREKYSRQPFWEQATAGHVNSILLRIARYHILDSDSSGLTSGERALLAKFVEIRMQVREEFAKPWSVEQMSRLACMSSSRFSVLYRKFFGNSPIDDLLEQRLEHAAYLLSATLSSVNEVAGACGFSSQHYFSRLFKKRMGCTPSSYARSEQTHSGRAHASPTGLPEAITEQHIYPENVENAFLEAEP